MNPENQTPTTAAITLEDLAAKLDELKALTAIGVKKVLTMKRPPFTRAGACRACTP